MQGRPESETESRPEPIIGNDEGGLRPPEEYGFWRKVWWWFDFLILVKLARLRFIAILVVIGFVITQWDRLAAYYDKWTRPEGDQAASSDFEYFCPMHPTVVRDNNKEKCPICFMPLSKRKKGSDTSEPLPAGVVNRVQLSPYRVVLAGVQTWKVNYQPLVKEINAVGYVEFNERGQSTVAARVKGRIDELFVNQTGALVEEKDVLASVYSPELFVAGQELLAAQKSASQSLVEIARSRLELLGIDDQQIGDILKSGEPVTHFKIRSPISGHVIEKYVVEGQYVEEGMPLYDVVDLSTVWIEAQIYEDDLPFLPVTESHNSGGSLENGPEVTATTRAFPGEEFKGILTFIYPHVDQTSRTVTVRFELPNPDHKLRPGSTATVTLRIPAKAIASLASAKDSPQNEQLARGQVLAVPESSVIDTGNQTIVYRESMPNVYEGVEVKLGPRMSGSKDVPFFPVLKGLEYGEQIVTSGSFLVDAETRLNPAAGSIYFGGSGGSKGPASTTIRSTTPEDPDAKIKGALAKLAPTDRDLAESQRFCPILTDSRLGSMGVPIKLKVEGQTVFVCCNGCKKNATDNPTETLKKIERLRDASNKEAQNSNDNKQNQSDEEETEITRALAELTPTDRALAEKQRYCVVNTESQLGSMGVPVKLTLEGEPVFICCEGCRDSAIEQSEEIVARLNNAETGEERQHD